MRQVNRLVLVIAAGLSVTAAAATPLLAVQPAPSAQPAVAPWANKFFLPDIATNRHQTPPPVITHDFGEVPHGTLCVHTFTITNIYDTPMQITEVRKSCACLDYVPLTKILEPNETAEFTITMNTGKFVGYNAQTFYVTFGPKFISTAVIRVSATSRTDVSIHPGAVGFGTVPQGTRAAQSVQIRYAGRQRDWRITEVVKPRGPFDVRVTETGRGGLLRGGVEYQVDVTLNGTAPAGPVSEPITLKTSDPHNPLLIISVTGYIIAPLELSPNRARLEAKIGDVTTQRILVRAAKPFKVLGVEGTGDGVSVELPPTTAALPIQVITVKFEPHKPGAVRRELRIRTDLDGNPAAVLSIEAEAITKAGDSPSIPQVRPVPIP